MSVSRVASASPSLDAWQPRTAVIRSIRDEIPGVATYDLAFADGAEQEAYRFAAGQFNMLYVPGVGEMAISISDDPARRDGIAHTIRVAGNVSGRLARMHSGDTLGVRGPYGAAWPLASCVGRDIILVAGGIGLAPLRPLIFSLMQERRNFGRIHLLFGARSPESLLYSNQYADWADGGVTVHRTVDRSSAGWSGNVGVVTLLLERLQAFDPANTILLCCGPEVMMRYTSLTAQQRGIDRERIWVSLERNMQCAIGLCGHCQLGPTFVCKEGPVYRYDKISPFLDVQGL